MMAIFILLANDVSVWGGNKKETRQQRKVAKFQQQQQSVTHKGENQLGIRPQTTNLTQEQLEAQQALLMNLLTVQAALGPNQLKQKKTKSILEEKKTEKQVQLDTNAKNLKRIKNMNAEAQAERRLEKEAQQQEVERTEWFNNIKEEVPFSGLTEEKTKEETEFKKEVQPPVVLNPKRKQYEKNPFTPRLLIGEDQHTIDNLGKPKLEGRPLSPTRTTLEEGLRYFTPSPLTDSRASSRSSVYHTPLSSPEPDNSQFYIPEELVSRNSSTSIISPIPIRAAPPKNIQTLDQNKTEVFVDKESSKAKKGASVPVRYEIGEISVKRFESDFITQLNREDLKGAKSAFKKLLVIDKDAARKIINQKNEITGKSLLDLAVEYKDESFSKELQNLVGYTGSLGLSRIEEEAGADKVIEAIIKEGATNDDVAYVIKHPEAAEATLKSVQYQKALWLRHLDKATKILRTLGLSEEEAAARMQGDLQGIGFRPLPKVPKQKGSKTSLLGRSPLPPTPKRRPLPPEPLLSIEDSNYLVAKGLKAKELTAAFLHPKAARKRIVKAREYEKALKEGKLNEAAKMLQEFGKEENEAKRIVDEDIKNLNPEAKDLRRIGPTSLPENPKQEESRASVLRRRPLPPTPKEATKDAVANLIAKGLDDAKKLEDAIKRNRDQQYKKLEEKLQKRKQVREELKQRTTDKPVEEKSSVIDELSKIIVSRNIKQAKDLIERSKTQQAMRDKKLDKNAQVLADYNEIVHPYKEDLDKLKVEGKNIREEITKTLADLGLKNNATKVTRTLNRKLTDLNNKLSRIQEKIKSIQNNKEYQLGMQKIENIKKNNAKVLEEKESEETKDAELKRLIKEAEELRRIAASVK